MADSVWEPSADLVTLSVSVNGSRIADSYLVRAVETDHAVNRIAGAIVTIADGSRVTTDFAASSSTDFEPGAEIEVQAGYHAKNTTIFRGLILGQSLRVDASGISSLRLVCKDKAVKLTVGRTAAQYTDASDSDIITKLLSSAGLSPTVSFSGAELPQQARTYATDWDFILTRAEANGQIVLVENGKTAVSPPRFDAPAYRAEYGDSILEVDLELAAENQVASLEARAWDPKSQSVATGSSSEPSVNAQGNLSGTKLADVLDVGQVALLSQATQTAEQLKTWADAGLLKARMSRFRGHITTPGNAGLKIGTQIELSGLGKKFDGNAYVTGVRHLLHDGEWHSELHFGLSPDWFADRQRDTSPAGASALRPAAPGLEIATVLQVYDDPDGERRIKVAMPLRENGDQGAWVRIASPYASNGFGIEFLPEVDDEVVLGFLSGDPDAAIILGALHSSARPSPNVPDEENTLKSIVTRAQHKITFDDVKKILTVETPGGHKIEMSDEAKTVTITDSNSNKIEMSEIGVNLTSPGDVSISADKSVSIKGETGITLSSPASVSTKGMSVSLEADSELTATGNASAELSSVGQTTVKGAMVMIN